MNTPAEQERPAVQRFELVMVDSACFCGVCGRVLRAGHEAARLVAGALCHVGCRSTFGGPRGY